MEDLSLSSRSNSKTIVEIYGQRFSIVGKESTDHIRKVASMVDHKMREINRKSPSLDINKLSILTAVNVTHDYVKLKEAYEKLEKQLIEKD